jgi:hypothetical protein
VKVKGAERVGDWMRRIQADQVEMRQYEYSSLVSVQEWSGAPKGVPLFESIVVFENFPIGESLREGKKNLQIQNINYALAPPHYPIAVAIVPGQELMIRVFFDCSRLHQETIQTVLRHFEILLRLIAGNPNMTINQTAEALTESDKLEEIQRRKDRKETRREKLRETKRKAAEYLNEKKR